MNAHLIEQSRRMDEINARIGRLYEVIVRREEHTELKVRLDRLEHELHELKTK